jgi:hypothetical protein
MNEKPPATIFLNNSKPKPQIISNSNKNIPSKNNFIKIIPKNINQFTLPPSSVFFFFIFSKILILKLISLHLLEILQIEILKLLIIYNMNLNFGKI